MSCTLSLAGKLFCIVEALRQTEIRLKAETSIQFNGRRSKLERGLVV